MITLPRLRSAKKRAPAPPPAFRAPAIPRLDPLPLPGKLKARLVRVRWRYRVSALLTGLAMVLTALAVLLTAQALSDWWFDLPVVARAVFLAGDVALIGFLLHGRVYGVLRRKFGLAEAALLVEKKWKSLRQSLISAVQLAEGGPGSSRGSPELLKVVFEQARARATSLDFREVVDLRPVRRWIFIAIGALAGAAAVGWFFWPDTVPLLERIVLLPVPRPTQTIVVAITRDLAVPVGDNVEISALARGVIPRHGTVTLTFAGSAPQDLPVTVDPDHHGVFRFSARNVQQDFTYVFHLNDGSGSEFTVRARVAPTVATLDCIEVYPAYTQLPDQPLAPTSLSLLAGSQLKLAGTVATAVQSATIVLQGLNRSVSATVDGSGLQFSAELPVPVRGLTGISVHLISVFGAPSANETVYPVDIVLDRPPVVKILEPEGERETITLQAKPHLVFDVRDDFGLTKVSVDYQLIPPAANGEQAPPGAVKIIPQPLHPAGGGTTYDFVFDPSTQVPPWHAGWTVNYWVEATDNNTVTGPGVTRTDHLQFGLLTPGEKMQEILAAQQQEAEKIDQISRTQNDVSTRVQQLIPPP